MDTLTKFSAFVIFSIGIYAVLTTPHILFFMSDNKIGIAYPIWLLMLMIVPSCIGGQILTQWVDKKNKE